MEPGRLSRRLGHMKPHRLLALPALAVAVLALAGCAPRPFPWQPPVRCLEACMASPPACPQCGTHPLPYPAPTVSPPAVGSTIYLTDANAGQSITVHSGQLIDVTLADSGQGWSSLSTTSPAVLGVQSAPVISGSTAHAAYRAAGPGLAQIIANERPPSCYPRCLPPQRSIVITITVVAPGA